MTNIYRKQAFDSIMCGCFCIGFIGFMLKGKNKLGYANLFWVVINRALTYTHPHPHVSSQKKVTPTYFQAKNGHTHPHLPALSHQPRKVKPIQT